MTTEHKDTKFRLGGPGDAAVIAALSIQVFLDTYAGAGVRPDLALEAFSEYSVARFSQRLLEPARVFVLAEYETGLFGFAEVLVNESTAPGGGFEGCEIVRLYVKPRAQRMGLGQRLIREAESLATQRSASGTWLTVWEGNSAAMAFYRRVGYTDAGATSYTFQGKAYGNRVYVKALPTPQARLELPS